MSVLAPHLPCSYVGDLLILCRNLHRGISASTFELWDKIPNTLAKLAALFLLWVEIKRA